MDSTTCININGFQSFGSLENAFWLKKQLLLHTSFPTTLSLLDENFKVIQQLVPDEDNPYTINGMTSVCTYKDMIYILDRESFTISVLDGQFEFIEKMKIPFFCQSIQVMSERTVALYLGNEPTEHNQGKLVIYDFLNKEVIKDLLPISSNQKRYFNFLTPYHFTTSSGHLLFWDSAINQIFALTNQELTPFLQLDYGSSGVSDDFYETAQFEDSFDFIMQMRTTDYAFRHFNLLANESKIKLTYERAGKFYHSVYDINKKTTRTFHSLTSPTLSTTPIDGDQLDFFVSLYGSNQALCFLPYEYLAEQAATFLNQNSTYKRAVESKENVLLFAALR